MTAVLQYPFFGRALNADGSNQSGAKAYYFETGTATPVSMFTDAALTVAAAVPHVADANGIFAPIYWAGDILTVSVFDSDDVQTPGFPIDNVAGQNISGIDAEDVNYTPTTYNAGTDAQQAITNNAANVRPVITGGTGADNATDARTNLGIAAASETVAGLVERATDAEVTTGTDTIRYMSVKQVIDKIAADIATEIAAIVLPTANETTQGIIEIATQAEVDAESDTSRAVVPSTLAAYVAAQIAANPAASFDFEAAIRGKADIGSTALNAMNGDERVLITLDNDSIRQITISDLVSKAGITADTDAHFIDSAADGLGDIIVPVYSGGPRNILIETTGSGTGNVVVSGGAVTGSGTDDDTYPNGSTSVTMGMSFIGIIPAGGSITVPNPSPGMGNNTTSVKVWPV